MYQRINKVYFGLLAAMLIALSACGGSGIEVTSSFTNTSDISEGTLVYFNDQVVGKVTDVKVQGTGSLIALSFDTDAAKLISEKSAVVVNRLKEGAPLEVYNRTEPDADGLQPGQQIKGIDSMFQLGAWMVGDVIQLGANSVSEYLESFQGYLQGDQFQQDKAQVQEQIETATVAAKEALIEMEKEMQQAAQELAKHESEAAASMEKLGEELAPLMEELSKSGTELAAEIEKFTQGLENAQGDEQQTGQQFLESLIATLEKLNQGFEQGAEPEKTE